MLARETLIKETLIKSDNDLISAFLAHVHSLVKYISRSYNDYTNYDYYNQDLHNHD